ncbi:hypothetical protein SAMN04488134_11355 [Amphibacillus marinus]|uniref:Fibronectin type-III domain-containing protein n=1 Tax=Amphibacillus marinus TaxID=872970 RepID=A0A1H8SP47_9BACI|nr:hypothetical protein [Amphibacillus marinus]SEO80345.1 hypothetical protein SAMN04488134_11355 [Amphibacillus marinus]
MIKILTLTILLSAFLPFMEIGANENLWYGDGILHDGTSVKRNDFPIEAYDLDLDTISPRIGYQVENKVEFNYLMDITGFIMNFSATYSHINIEVLYYNEQEETVESMRLQPNRFDHDMYHEVDIKNVLSINIASAQSGQSVRIREVDFFGVPSSNNITLPSAVNVDIHRAGHNEIDFNISNIDDITERIKVYQNGSLVDDIAPDELNQGIYTARGLAPETNYDFNFVSVSTEGYESGDANVNVTTAPIPEIEEIVNVEVEASHDRVDLSWSMPSSGYVDHVNIYRRTTTEQEISMLDFLKPMIVNASEDFAPLFETNGTYFNDLSVEENSSYEYKLTTEYAGVESQGVIVQATTGLMPAPDLDGDDYEELPNGDYLVTWQQPETGQVRILVDGREYVTVPASDHAFTIPAADMRYSSLGRPLVSIQTIGENGEESPPIDSDQGNAEVPFTVVDLVTTTNGLLMLIGSFVLLGLAFIFAPKVVQLIRRSIKNRSSADREGQAQANFSVREEKAQARAMRQVERSHSIGSGRAPREGRIGSRQRREPRQGRV